MGFACEPGQAFLEQARHPQNTEVERQGERPSFELNCNLLCQRATGHNFIGGDEIGFAVGIWVFEAGDGGFCEVFDENQAKGLIKTGPRQNMRVDGLEKREEAIISRSVDTRRAQDYVGWTALGADFGFGCEFAFPVF